MQWEYIKFVNFDDFYNNRKIIRYYYKRLPLDEKWKYKRFVYSDALKENETDKNSIWNFLNENEYCKQELLGRKTYRDNVRLRKTKKDIDLYKDLLNFKD